MSHRNRDIERDIALLQAFARGENNVVIGRKLGLTRERVRQLLGRLGIHRRRLKHGGYAAVAPAHTEETLYGREGHAGPGGADAQGHD